MTTNSSEPIQTDSDDWEYEYTTDTTMGPTTHYIPLHLPPRQSSTSNLASTGTAQLLTRATDNPLLALDGRLYVIQQTESIGSYMFLDKQTGELVGTGREGGLAKAAVVREGGQGDIGKSGARRWKEKLDEAKMRREAAEKRREEEEERRKNGELEKNRDGGAM